MKSNLPFYIYLSFVLHCYILLTITLANQSGFLEKIFKVKKEKVTKVENIFVETFTISKEAPTKALFSDKQNINSSPKKGPDTYNYLNFNQLKNKESSQDEKTPDKEGDLIKNTEKKNEEKNEIKLVKDSLPTLFDLNNPVTIEMDNEGKISLGTIQYEYASYFLEMQKKISENWRSFFPVFQYYQGIIKSGDVIVQFQISENGDVISPQVVKSYGYSILDKSCLNAVIYSKNFGRLPDELKKYSPINIHFRFIYIAR